MSGIHNKVLAGVRSYLKLPTLTKSKSNQSHEGKGFVKRWAGVMQVSKKVPSGCAGQVTFHPQFSVQGIRQAVCQLIQ